MQLRASLSSTVSLSKGNTHHIINSNQRGGGGGVASQQQPLINTNSRAVLNNNAATSSSQTLAKKIRNDKEARKEILRSNYVNGSNTNNYNNRGASMGITKTTLAGPATNMTNIARVAPR
jgi:hypothetical protein